MFIFRAPRTDIVHGACFVSDSISCGNGAAEKSVLHIAFEDLNNYTGHFSSAEIKFFLNVWFSESYDYIETALQLRHNDTVPTA